MACSKCTEKINKLKNVLCNLIGAHTLDEMYEMQSFLKLVIGEKEPDENVKLAYDSLNALIEIFEEENKTICIESN